MPLRRNRWPITGTWEWRGLDEGPSKRSNKKLSRHRATSAGTPHAGAKQRPRQSRRGFKFSPAKSRGHREETYGPDDYILANSSATRASQSGEPLSPWPPRRRTLQRASLSHGSANKRPCRRCTGQGQYSVTRGDRVTTAGISVRHRWRHKPAERFVGPEETHRCPLVNPADSSRYPPSRCGAGFTREPR